MFTGSMVAIVTPLTEDAVDISKLEELTKWHIENGTHGMVPCGTTGESVTLTDDERADVIRAIVKVARGKVPTIVGTGTNCTRTTIEYSKMAKELGADGVLLVAPYYNKPPQQGLFLHFEAAANAVDLPVILYNVPGRTSSNIAVETTARLSKIKNIVAIKEATGDVENVTRIRDACDITVLSGDDGLTCNMMTRGAKGVISVAANIIPGEISTMCQSMLSGEEAAARKKHDHWINLFEGLFLESNPIPVKAAMEMMGLIRSGTPRLPLCDISDGGRDQLRALLESYKLV